MATVDSPRDRTGFVVLQQPAVALAAYEARFEAGRRAVWAAFRAALPHLSPECYRGLGRPRILPYPSLDERVIDQFRATGCEMDADARARRRYCEFITAYDQQCGYQRDTPDWLLSPEDACEVWRLLDRPAQWDVIGVSRDQAAPRSAALNPAAAATMGYDVGWICNYSIISDAMLMPVWHGPESEVWRELAVWGRQLNDQQLFPRPDVAGAYLDWYRTRPWAERDCPEAPFLVLQIVAVQPTCSR